MPSGSHGGGGGGSHGGGGGHGGGGSHFGGGHGGGYRYRGPMRMRWGRTHYVIPMGASRCISFLFVLLVFAFFGIFVSSVLMTSSKSYLRKIEQDYIYYQDMVSYAKTHTDHQIEGTVITKYYKESYKKWYVTYYFPTPEGKVEGYTFSVYTFDDVKDIRAGDKILLAVDGLPLNKNTDSVPMDYGDMPIEKDGEYQTFKSQKKGSTTALIVCVSVAGGIILISILTALLKKVKVQEHPTSTTTRPVYHPTEEHSTAQTSSTATRTYCQYCGAEMSSAETKCKRCGGRQQ